MPRSIPVAGYQARGFRTVAQRLSVFVTLATSAKLVVPVVLLGVVAAHGDRERMAFTWVVAIAAAILYDVISPASQFYLLHPLYMVAGLSAGLVSAFTRI